MICARPPCPPRRGGQGGAQRAPAMTGINVPPFPPLACGGERGGGEVHVAEAVHYLYARKYITGSKNVKAPLGLTCALDVVQARWCDRNRWDRDTDD